MEGPLLWFVNRGTGVALLLLLTVTTVLGVLATRGDAGRGLPRFVTQSLHRNLGLVSLALLLAHVVTAVLDEYVDIRWWHALAPVGATYEPVSLGLGALALDLLVAAAVTSVVRHRLAHGAWRAVHVVTYVAWVLAVLHGIGIGTDARTGWGIATTLASVAAVGAAAAVRVVGLASARPGPVPR
ncbi:ferric reductase-like transmembrane domain-containing protein [Intrasporangium sp.]|uniref:ferric reductase-like transmembrane domain-containing protein n=1 Tax=Intrasporangium sp. TaxID=1925024 RepID=UPI00293A7DE4|nr:ferric reductase-like transmembrane domain-containing protein [Intrasporangium sp.]MDV3221496.1 ferric reductase-like transmembrane domain-containing protein [Intrasporangium sp.]